MKIESVSGETVVTFRRVESPRDKAFTLLKKSGVHIENLEVVRDRQEKMLGRIRRPVLGYSLLALQFLGVIVVLLAGDYATGRNEGFGTPDLFVAFMTAVSGAALVGYASLLSGKLKTRLFARWHVRSLDGFTLPPDVEENVRKAKELFPGATYWVETLDEDPAVFVEMYNWRKPFCLGMWGFERYLP